jgi:hypothetical protein
VAIEQNIYTFEDYVGTQGGTNGFDGRRSIHNATKLEDGFPKEVVDLIAGKARDVLRSRRYHREPYRSGFHLCICLTLIRSFNQRVGPGLDDFRRALGLFVSLLALEDAELKSLRMPCCDRGRGVRQSLHCPSTKH